MKTKFHGYYRPTKEEFDSLWNVALIVFDANVLLNLYSYSHETREEFLLLLEEIKGRIWLPYQVADEYHLNRCRTINNESKKYDNVLTKLREVRGALGSSTCHPFIDADLMMQFVDLFSRIEESLMDGKNEHTLLMRVDPICDKLTAIFESRVGDPFSTEEMKALYIEGEERFSKEIPPGYKDKKKSGLHKYGDFVLWKQVIRKSKEDGRAVILVTEDRKEDWWSTIENNKIGPRPELLQEFQSATGNPIYIYGFKSFIEYAKKQGKKVSESALTELEAAKKAREAQELKHNEEETLLNTLTKYEDYNRSLGDFIKGIMIDEKTIQSAFNEMNKNLLPIIDPEVLQKFMQATNPIPLTAYSAMLSAIIEAKTNPVTNPRVTQGLLGSMLPPLQYEQEKNKLVEKIKDQSQTFNTNERFIPDDKKERPSGNNLTEDISSEREEEMNEGDDEQD